MNGQLQKREVQALEASNGDPDRKSGGSAAAQSTEHRNKSTFKSATNGLIEQLVSRQNMEQAYTRVLANKGAPGVDGISTVQLKEFLWQNWPQIKGEILSGAYRPQPVKRVEIPKPNGGTRKLGIPTVIDRLIQQALHQVLSPIFDPTFSKSSYGFRPRRCAQDAIKQARSYIAGGKRWVVDMDLEKFFDRVNHDILMERVRRQVDDVAILRLIRGFLRAGVMIGGIVEANTEGTPQGGPLSPLLSNIMLNDLDRELERRGHTFCRYADDCNIYVQSEKAGQRVLDSISNFLETKLKLKVNREKSAVGRPWHRKFLGYSFTSAIKTKIRIDGSSIKKLKEKVLVLMRKGRGKSLNRFIKYDLNPVLRGWSQYFKEAQTPSVSKRLDQWILRRLRVLVLRQWGRAKVRFRKLVFNGVDPNRAFMAAYASRGPYPVSNYSVVREGLPWTIFAQLGLVSVQRIMKNWG